MNEYEVNKVEKPIQLESLNDIFLLLDQINKSQIQELKVQIGNIDTFDYDKYKQFSRKWNLQLHQLYVELQEWNEIFKKYHTITSDTFNKINMDDINNKKIQNYIISNYIFNNFFQ